MSIVSPQQPKQEAAVAHHVTKFDSESRMNMPLDYCHSESQLVQQCSQSAACTVLVAVFMFPVRATQTFPVRVSAAKGPTEGHTGANN